MHLVSRDGQRRWRRSTGACTDRKWYKNDKKIPTIGLVGSIDDEYVGVHHAAQDRLLTKGHKLHTASFFGVRLLTPTSYEFKVFACERGQPVLHLS